MSQDQGSLSKSLTRFIEEKEGEETLVVLFVKGTSIIGPMGYSHLKLNNVINYAHKFDIMNETDKFCEVYKGPFLQWETNYITTESTIDVSKMKA